ncbi:hypothetical protein SAMN05216600_1393 [Pseudomonas cuatrocienegasensis]|uniref:Uncharacterized protein n=1 Tax=Pseudomonas cuatrocienegasensis TaxID=543360 RepID=A0ABY1BRY7_9PSED|nr:MULTISPECIES: hypothetical protein [Pseudomonas]OEC32541.1 hypothetical protein A7D25_23575 [Pseudomonas sp. 21C1]SER48812.1 hypothetical protein SAMN05216600_1393 [Pseudomonas cuatrocienegasensis]
MHADRNDAPWRVQRKNANPVVWVASVAFGLGVTFGGLYLGGSQMQSNQRDMQVTRQSAEAAHKRNQEEWGKQDRERHYQAQAMDERKWIRSSDDAQGDQQALAAWSQARAQEQHERQSSFNDANYRP